MTRQLFQQRSDIIFITWQASGEQVPLVFLYIDGLPKQEPIQAMLND